MGAATSRNLRAEPSAPSARQRLGMLPEAELLALQGVVAGVQHGAHSSEARIWASQALMRSPASTSSSWKSRDSWFTLLTKAKESVL